MSYKEWLIGRNLRRFSPQSFYRWGDKNCINKIAYANYFKNGGIPIDVQVKDINDSEGYEAVEIEDVIQFVYTYIRNPFSRKIKPSCPDYNITF